MRKFFHPIIYSLIVILTVSTLANNVPIPEHPQPDFSRDQWLNLNGTWKFAFDPESKGESEGWNRADWADWLLIKAIPSHWKSTFTKTADVQNNGTAWYQRTFTIPTGWMDKTILLHFGKVDWHARVWIDGHFLGAGDSAPLSFPINSVLATTQEHTLTIEASNQSKNKSPDSKHWQGIYIDATPTARSAYIQDIQLETSRDGMLYIDVTPKGKFKQKASIAVLPDTPLDDRAHSTSIHSSDAYEGLRGEYKVDNPQQWTKETPILYYMKVNLFDGSERVDSIHTRFAFR